MTFKRIFCCIWFMLFMSINALFAIMLPEGTDAIISRVEKYPSGKIKSAELSEPTELNTPIGKFTFGGTVTFHENGIIRSAGVTDYNYCITIKTPAGEFAVSELSFYESGKPECFCLCEEGSVQTSIGELKVNGWVRLYESGNLYECNIGYDSVAIQNGKYAGIPISHKISFYENGNIESFNPKEQMTTNIGKIKPIGTVRLYEDGNLRSAEIKTQVFDTLFGLLSLNSIEVFPSGKFKRISISGSISITLPENYYMYNEINKKSVGEKPYSFVSAFETNTIGFYEDGAVKWVEYTNSIKDNRSAFYVFYNFGHIWFYKSGKPMGFGRVWYNNDRDEYKFEDMYCFSENGTFLGPAVLDNNSDTLKKAIQEKNK